VDSREQQSPQNIATGTTDASWGASLLHQLPPETRRWLRATLTVYQRITPILPLVAVAVMLLLMAQVYYNVQRYYTKPGYKGIAAFADIGLISGSHLGLNDLVMNNNPTGFDGQFYYFIALDPKQPLICAERPRPANCALDSAFGEVRAERILYPYIAGILTFGAPQLVPYTLLLVNFAAILLTAWLVGRLAVDAGASVWMGAAAGFYCGEVMGFLRDVADPVAVFWVILAIYLLRKERYLWMSLAICGALLTREQLVLTIPLLFVPLIAGRRWFTLGLGLLIGLGPFVVWQLALRILWGKWALANGDTAGAGVDHGLGLIPFHGLWDERTHPQFGLIIAFVVIPLVLATVISLVHIWRAGPGHLLLDPVPVIVIFYTLLLSLTSGILWRDMWTPGRLAALAIVLGVILVSELPTPSLRASYATLLSISSLVAIILVG
jgi:hypothetical protein